MSATTKQLLSSCEFCKQRHDTTPVKTHLQTFLSIPITQKMPDFELWHCRRQRADIVAHTETQIFLIFSHVPQYASVIRRSC